MITGKEQVTQEHLPAMIVDIYCRVSSTSQEDNTSLDEQEENGRKFAEANGFTVGLVHREVGSGYTLERKKLKLMQERYRSGEIQGVIIWKVSRLARKHEFINYLMVEMDIYHCRIFCVHTPLNEKDDDYQLRIFMESFFADRERKEIVSKLRSAKALYGYDFIIVKGKKVGFTINEVKREYVEEAHRLFDTGETLNGVLRYLRGADPSRKWHATNVKDMLRDVLYTGKGAKAFFKHRKDASFVYEQVDLPDGYYPKIIDEQVKERCQKRLEVYAMDAPKRNLEPEKYLLRGGFIICSICGKPMMCNKARGANSRYAGRRYVCRKRPGGHLMSMNSKLLDEQVWVQLVEIAKESPLIKQAIEKILATDLGAQAIQKLDKSIQVHQARIDKMQEDLDEGRVTDDIRSYVYERMSVERASIDTLEALKKDKHAQAREVAKKREVYLRIYEWYNRIHESNITGKDLSYEDKREFMRFIGLKITVYKPEYKQSKARRWTMEASIPGLSKDRGLENVLPQVY